eukprot:CAMPEP_0117594850 /NCGR_PEP_ID=MMETSP0784-20121206/73438_1 /TAXON_ID=39447 /ORGANISM="" /LENGTH=131 /DNA_ID=CAMNT_0005396971 /DNA_START=97 /DNA_END=488 /DNA_ORIENTATION=+
MSEGSRNYKGLVLRYNYFLNTLNHSLESEKTSLETLKSHYRDLTEFVRTLSPQDREEIQGANKDWDTNRRRELQQRCRDRGLLSDIRPSSTSGPEPEPPQRGLDAPRPISTGGSEPQPPQRGADADDVPQA